MVQSNVFFYKKDAFLYVRVCNLIVLLLNFVDTRTVVSMGLFSTQYVFLPHEHAPKLGMKDKSSPTQGHAKIIVKSWKEEESLFPQFRGRRISRSAFLSRRPFGYYLPIASYGTIFAAKWSSNGGLEAVVSK